MSGKRAALLVGVEYYKDWDQLPACSNDVDEMEAVLAHHADGSPNFSVTTVKGTAGDPMTRRTLMDEFDLLLTDAGDSDLLFYFSGHGATSRFGLQLGVSDAESSYDAGVSFEVLMHRARYENFRSLTCILDCCFSGTATEIGLEDVGISLMPPNQTVLASSQRDDVSKASALISDYTFAVVNGLKGAAVDSNARVTPLELHRHAITKMGTLGNSHPVWKANLPGPVILRQC